MNYGFQGNILMILSGAHIQRNFFFSSKYNSDDASNPLGNISVYLVERNISLLERIISGKDY